MRRLMRWGVQVLVVAAAVALGAGGAGAQGGWSSGDPRGGPRGGDGPRGRGGRWDDGARAMPNHSVINGPMAPADLMVLVPLTVEQQRWYVAAYDSVTALTKTQRDTLYAFIAAHRPKSPRGERGPGGGERPAGGPETDSSAPAGYESGDPPSDPAPAEDGDVSRTEADDEPQADADSGIPGAGSPTDPARMDRRAFVQQALTLAEPLEESQDAFEKLMPRILTKAQYKTYKAWFESHNEVKKQYPRWHGHHDPDANGARYGQ